MMGDTTSGPSDIGAEALDIDVTDNDELREHLLRVAEDGEANDYETMADRLTALLSGARAAKAQTRGGDNE
jgi:hypothetical protein